MQIVIINLADSQNRRDYMLAQFDALSQQGLHFDFQFFPAVYGKNEPNHPLFQHYNHQKRVQRKGKGLSLSELGCFASHFQAWQKCIADNQPLIVLEDDVKLTPHFATFYQNADQYAQKFRFLWLHKNNLKTDYYLIAQDKHFSVVKFYKDYIGTLGYLITPDVAKLLINAFQEVIYPVDNQMARCFENNLNNYALVPACIEEDGQLESTIKHARENHELSVKQKAIREFYNLKDKFKRFLYHKKHFAKSQKYFYDPKK